MNIAVLCFDFSRNGGSEKVAANLSKACSVKYVTHLISLFSNNDTQINIGGNVVSHVVSNHKSFFVSSFIRTFLNLSNYCKVNNINIVISVGINCALYACLLKLFLKIPVIVCEHSNMANSMYNSWRQKVKRRFAVLFANRLITLTETDAELYKKKYPKNEIKIGTIYNWIDDNWFNDDVTYDSNSKKIITVCRLDRVKGLERGIDVLAKILETNYDWQWHIYGSGDEDYKKELIEKTKQLGIQDNVIFQGQVTENELKTIYPLYSLYLCTSYFEGMPMSLLEAKVKKIPIISFNCQTGPAEIIDDNINGLLIRQGDVEELFAALKRFIDDGKFRKNLSEQSYSNINKFKKENIVKQWFSLIDNCK